jgi:hypothetical protein
MSLESVLQEARSSLALSADVRSALEEEFGPCLEPDDWEPELRIEELQTALGSLITREPDLARSVFEDSQYEAAQARARVRERLLREDEQRRREEQETDLREERLFRLKLGMHLADLLEAIERGEPELIALAAKIVEDDSSAKQSLTLKIAIANAKRAELIAQTPSHLDPIDAAIFRAKLVGIEYDNFAVSEAMVRAGCQNPGLILDPALTEWLDWQAKKRGK